MTQKPDGTSETIAMSEGELDKLEATTTSLASANSGNSDAIEETGYILDMPDYLRTWQTKGFTRDWLGFFLWNDRLVAKERGERWKKIVTDRYNLPLSTARILVAEAGGGLGIKAKPPGTERERVRKAVAANRQRKRDRDDVTFHNLMKLHDTMDRMLRNRQATDPTAKFTRDIALAGIADYFAAQSNECLDNFFRDGRL